MKRTRCHICEAKSQEEVCGTCGAVIASPTSERLVLTSKRNTSMDFNNGSYSLSASCNVALTSRRLVIYNIISEEPNPAFSVLKSLVNVNRKRRVSIDLEDIEYVRRYDKTHLIKTKSVAYSMTLTDFDEWDRALTKYKKHDER